MRADAWVLELGCNHGRTMLGLVDYLKPPGRYEGLDILKAEIEFAQKHIHAAYSHFNFTHADIQNSFYNPEGRLRPETYQFPYEDAAFDIIYAASLFTHLLPPSLVNYFRESRRVLKKGGRCLFSFFLLDYYQGPGTTQASVYEFDHPLSDGTSGDDDMAAVYSPDRPERVIAYKRAFVERVASDCGFKVERVLPGFWSKSQACAVNEQDLILLEVG
jgi:SAM-dependent methyltransferase